MKNILKGVLFSVCLACCVYAAGDGVYKAFFRERAEINVQYVVRPGDTMWNICDEFYITKNNVECFNEFVHRNTKRNGSLIHAGDIVTISNRVWK